MPWCSKLIWFLSSISARRLRPHRPPPFALSLRVHSPPRTPSPTHTPAPHLPLVQPRPRPASASSRAQTRGTHLWNPRKAACTDVAAACFTSCDDAARTTTCHPQPRTVSVRVRVGACVCTSRSCSSNLQQLQVLRPLLRQRLLAQRLVVRLCTNQSGLIVCNCASKALSHSFALVSSLQRTLSCRRIPYIDQPSGCGINSHTRGAITTCLGVAS